MGLLIRTGDYRNTLCDGPSNYICGHYISHNRVSLLSLQDPLVLLCNILYNTILCVPWDADSFDMPKSPSCYYISGCSLPHVESFFRLPDARPENSKVVDLVLLDLPHILVSRWPLDFTHDQLVLVAVVLIAFPVAFASLFAYCIGKLNFQRR
ncbi:hypothetical protein ACOSP7_007801 [Xanthoceras sorbifolium]